MCLGVQWNKAVAVGLVCSAATAGGDCGQWAQVEAPNPPESVNTWLKDVAVVSADDAWAVGYFTDNVVFNVNEDYTYVLRWNGESWERVPSPSPGLPYDGGTKAYLEAVDVIAADDVWAVGHYKTQQSHGHVGPQPLTLHWDGSAWEHVPAPQSVGESSGAILYDVVAIASDDVWAGGTWPSPSGYGFEAFMLHWDGSEWTPVPTPIAAYSQLIWAMTAVSSDDIWAVGRSGSPTATSYVIHWDGSSWEQVSAPSPSYWNFLRDVDAVASDDVWIAGEQWDTDISYQPLMLHWDGSSWTEVPSPGGGQSIVALASDDVWSADTWTTGGSIAHFDGVSWTVRDTVAGPDRSTLLGMAAVGPCDVWAVGRQPGGFDFLPLIERLTPGVVAGDCNGDGRVDGADLAILLGQWGPAPAPGSGSADLNGDGVVDGADLAMLLGQWS